MYKLDRHITISFLGGCLPVMLLLLSLFSFLTLAEELEDVGKGSYELLDALLVVLYTLPARLVELLPVTMLLGGLMGLGALANQQELIAMRAAALSSVRVSVPIAKLSIALICVVMLLQAWIIPILEYGATQVRAQTLVEAGGDSGTEFWTRNDCQFIRIGDIQRDRTLSDVEIYQFDTNGKLKQLLQTHRAELLDENTWLLHDVRRTELAGEQSETRIETRLIWEDLLTGEQAQTLITPAQALAPI